MTLSELAGYDGQNGHRAYIAVNGTVYDVTESPLWKNGLHPPDHQAGQDLTEELAKAPHVRTVVERFPVVATLGEKPSAQPPGGGVKTTGIIIAAMVIALLLYLII